MINILNLVNIPKVKVVRTAVFTLSLVTAISSIAGCKDDKGSEYIFDGVQNATVDENSGIYTITMNDGDIYHISKEDIDSTYDYDYDPYIYESWCPRELNNNDGDLDSIDKITSEQQMKNATEDNDVVLVKKIQ